METKFNFNSQICTSREQSERLLSLGLNKETADMCLDYIQVGWIEVDGYDLGTITQLEPIAHPPVMQSEIPAWSLHRLLNLLPHKYGEYCVFANCYMWYNNHHLDIAEQFDGSNQYEYIINCIEWLIKEGCFNKEYLL